jgi:hypothetical protein
LRLELSSCTRGALALYVPAIAVLVLGNEDIPLLRLFHLLSPPP